MGKVHILLDYENSQLYLQGELQIIPTFMHLLFHVILNQSKTQKSCIF